jgi:ferrous-iron efflux pump FieF
MTAAGDPAQGAALQRSAALMRRATYASVAVATVMIIVKFVAWSFADSVSLLSSLLDSVLDAGASLVNLIAIEHAVTPADREHRFGHGKVEPLAGLGQAAFIAGSSVLLLIQALQRFIHPAKVEGSALGIIVMIFAIAVTLVLLRYQSSVVRRTGSLVVSGDALHYRADLVLNFSVILSLALTYYLGWIYVDPIFGAAIGLWLVYGAWQLAANALTQLMDRELPDEDRARIRAIALRHPEVKAVHDLRTRAAGPTAFIQIHLEMDGDMTLLKAHDVADAVEAEIREAFPRAEVMSHQDPEGVDEQRLSFPPRAARPRGSQPLEDGAS